MDYESSRPILVFLLMAAPIGGGPTKSKPWLVMDFGLSNELT
jgi:hypothetical protein